MRFPVESYFESNKTSADFPLSTSKALIDKYTLLKLISRFLHVFESAPDDSFSICSFKSCCSRLTMESTSEDVKSEFSIAITSMNNRAKSTSRSSFKISEDDKNPPPLLLLVLLPPLSSFNL